MVARYYATQIPQVFIILLPVALLLSLLFALGRMSRSNEIVSMLTAGVSLPRVLLPLIGIGLGKAHHRQARFVVREVSLGGTDAAVLLHEAFQILETLRHERVVGRAAMPE